MPSRKRRKPTHRPRSAHRIHWLRWALLLSMGGLILYQSLFFAHLAWWNHHDPGVTAFMDERLHQARSRKPGATIRHRWVPYSAISAHLKRAVIASEDSSFLRHNGFDWEGMRLAVQKNLRRGRLVAGGSTISQQLAKNLFLSSDRSLLRKGQEAIITLMMESIMSKRRILEIYLNVVEWGDLLFGAEAAARRYFGVSAAALSPEQAAKLAVMLPSPRRFERNPDSDYLRQRAQFIVEQLHLVRIP